MKKLILLILLINYLFPQINQNQSYTHKMIYLESQQKNALVAVSLEILIPNGGYHYLDRAAITNLPFSLIRWGSGVASLFFINLEEQSIKGECTCMTKSFTIDDEEVLFQLAVYSLFTIIQMHDLIEKTAEYNNNVYRKIFNSEPPSFSLNLQPTYQGANFTMSYSFN